MLGGSLHHGCGDTPNAQHCCMRVGHETISDSVRLLRYWEPVFRPVCYYHSLSAQFTKPERPPRSIWQLRYRRCYYIEIVWNRYITQARLQKPTSQHLQANWMSCGTTFNRRPRLCLWTNCVSAPLHVAWRRWRIATPIWQPALAPLAATCHHLPMHAGEHKEHNLPGMKSRRMKVPGMKCCDSRRPCG